MRELLPVVSDDLVWAETESRTPADRVASVGFMGLWWELDLTSSNYAELAEFMERYKRAGRRTDKPATTQANVEQARNESEAMRAWADETEFRTSKGEPGYHKNFTGKGGYYHSLELRRAWADHKAEEADGLGSDRPQ